MNRKEIQKHIKKDLIYSFIILLFLTSCLLITTFSLIIENPDKTVKAQLINIFVSTSIGIIISKKFYKKFDMFLHKYIFKSYI